MNNVSDVVQVPEASRRRFLWVFGTLLGALGTLGLARQPRSAPEARAADRDLPLKEADFYRPHDLAG
jgi:hypothetical protein